MNGQNFKIETEWLNKPLDQKTLVNISEFAKDLAKKDGGLKSLSTSQLRKFFGEMKRIQIDFEKKKNEIPKLSVLLAYAVGRDKNKFGKNETKIFKFYNALKDALNSLIDNPKKEEFDRLVNIVEAIVAYHKYYGGK